MSDTLKDLERQCDYRRDVLEFIDEHQGETWDDIDPEDIPEGIDRDDVETDGNEGEALSLVDYCAYALDVEIQGRYDHLEGSWTVTGVEVLFTCGGPDIRLEGSTIVGRWGGDVVRRHVSGDIASYIEEAFSEGVES